MFYMNHSLCDSSSGESSYFSGRVPKLPEILKRLEKSQSSLARYLQTKVLLPKSLEIKVIKDTNCSTAAIYLILTTSDNLQYYLANCQLSEVKYNCGAIHIANLYSDQSYGSGITWDFYKLVEDWCKYAGYTFIHGNVAGGQLNLIPKFEKLGYKKMGKPYKNTRSGNINVWMYKLIQEGADTDQPDFDEDQEDNEGDYNEDEDF